MSTAAALVGLVLAVFGVRMLVTGRVPALLARSFRSPREAGGYHLLSGVAVLMFAAGTWLPDVAAMAATVLSIGLVAAAGVWFRPRASAGRRE
ncbi:hypothetical protein [Actinoplanes italicus]|jgi:hypothetical protein|uniref:Integral membrane protein n=1 Tax=Actinoplanes italicus TaxID=113567 RepID=A0A2T0KQ93_9ACTN|nr:hypothetical protein [Actinoplanes italicus]PRX25923.1 hypothetical protein CLV67_101648 [Actinoplanes italicus]